MRLFLLPISFCCLLLPRALISPICLALSAFPWTVASLVFFAFLLSACGSFRFLSWLSRPWLLTFFTFSWSLAIRSFMVGIFFVLFSLCRLLGAPPSLSSASHLDFRHWCSGRPGSPSPFAPFRAGRLSHFSLRVRIFGLAMATRVRGLRGYCKPLRPSALRSSTLRRSVGSACVPCLPSLVLSLLAYCMLVCCGTRCRALPQPRLLHFPPPSTASPFVYLLSHPLSPGCLAPYFFLGSGRLPRAPLLHDASGSPHLFVPRLFPVRARCPIRLCGYFCFSFLDWHFLSCIHFSALACLSLLLPLSTPLRPCTSLRLLPVSPLLFAFSPAWCLLRLSWFASSGLLTHPCPSAPSSLRHPCYSAFPRLCRRTDPPGLHLCSSAHVTPASPSRLSPPEPSLGYLEL